MQALTESGSELVLRTLLSYGLGGAVIVVAAVLVWLFMNKGYRLKLDLGPDKKA